MSYYIRFMRREDLSQVVEIDREAFPNQWPPTNYRNELDNRLAHYVVAVDRNPVPPTTAGPPPEPRVGLLTRLRQLFSRSRARGTMSPPLRTEYIAGFAGCWIMADEAHITEIAVRATYKGRGIGELLMVCLTDLARQYKASYLTLEVRQTNTLAQSLYRKFGYNQVGIRRAYYTDNKEDALIMTTDNISSPGFTVRVEEIRKTLAKKLSMDHLQILSQE